MDSAVDRQGPTTHCRGSTRVGRRARLLRWGCGGTMTSAVESTDKGITAGRGVLVATCVSTLVVNANTSAVTILLPAIAEDVDAPISTLQWAVTGYSLVGAAFIVTSGALGDVFGRRKVFLGGLAAVHRVVRADRTVRQPGRCHRRAGDPGRGRFDDPGVGPEPAHRRLLRVRTNACGVALGGSVGGRRRCRAARRRVARRLGRMAGPVLDRRRDRGRLHPGDDHARSRSRATPTGHVRSTGSARFWSPRSWGH